MISWWWLIPTIFVTACVTTILLSAVFAAGQWERDRRAIQEYMESMDVEGNGTREQ